MKNANTVLVGLCLLLLFLNIYSLFHIRRLSGENKMIVENYFPRSNSFEKIISKDWLSSMRSSGYLQQGEYGENMDGPFLVLRIAEYHCSTCIDFLVPFLHDIIGEFGERSVVLLTSYREERKVTAFKQANGLNVTSYDYVLPEHPVEDLNVPYCFIVDEAGEVGYLFVPRKELPAPCEGYFDQIKRVLAGNSM